MKKRLSTQLCVVISVMLVMALALCVSADTQDGWVPNGNGTWSYNQNGAPVVNEEFYDSGYYYRTDAYGIMLENQWYEDTYGNWYYYGPGGARIQGGVRNIGGYYYAFDNNGVLAIGQHIWFYSEEVTGYIRTDNSGILYVNQWFEDSWSNWYYYGANGAAVSGLQQIGGYTYYFADYGWMYENTTIVLTDSSNIPHYYVISPDGFVTEVAPSGWSWAYGHYYYVQDGHFVENSLLTVGGLRYGFDYDGKMYANEQFDMYDGDYWYYFCAKADGSLYTYEWYKDSYGDWHFYGEAGRSVSGYQEIGGYAYYFSDAGRMYTESVIEGSDVGYIADKNGFVTVIQPNSWVQVGNDWYYAQMGEYGIDVCYSGIYLINGSYYGFDSDHTMYNGEAFYRNGNYYRAQTGGALYQNAWYLDEYGYWYFYTEDGTAATGLTEYYGYLYAFGYEGRMITNELYDYAYIIGADGIATPIANNAWTLYNNEYYYMQDGVLCYSDIYLINGSYYAFGYGGAMYDNESCYLDYEYRAQPGGALYQNAWYQAPSGDWYYYGQDCAGVDGLVDVYGNGVYYGFYDGLLEEDAIVYGEVDGHGGYYCTDDAGILVTTPGWRMCGGNWVYIQESGVLYCGWMNGYYLWPEMIHDDIWLIDDLYYVFDENGTATLYTGSGWYYGRYVENLTYVTDGWKYIDGYWYYFDSYGDRYTSWKTIDDVNYLFANDGRMLSGGWVRSSNGDWAYADTSGALLTGLQDFGAYTYFFNSYGRLLVNDYTWVDNERFYADENGVLTKVVEEESHQEGWVYTGSGWIYYDTWGDMVYGTRKIDGDYYYFDYSTGIMATNSIHNGRYHGADGKACSGWISYMGSWLYADPEENLELADGRITIGGNAYYFINSYTAAQGTFWYGNYIVTTNADGAVISELPIADGWTYVGGYVLYYQNGAPYTGWVGEYYIYDGYMQRNTIFSINGNRYYLNNYGQCVTGGWIERYEGAWIYARADGTLYHDQWAQIGGSWYYFDGSYIVTGAYEIDGVLELFTEDGVWTGSAQGAEKSWVYTNGNWYYYHAGQPVYGEYFIDGYWYAFDSYGMITNSFYYDYYYGSDGIRVAGNSWIYLGGDWCYLGAEGTSVYGWFQVNGTWYYQSGYIYTGVNYMYVNGTYGLHQFTADGAYVGKVQQEYGWFQAGDDWYFFENGELFEGYKEINGVVYRFWPEMAKDTISYVGGKARYFDSTGAMVTRQGWIDIFDGTTKAYINEYGEVLYDGVHWIEGRYYYFDSYYGYGMG